MLADYVRDRRNVALAGLCGARYDQGVAVAGGDAVVGGFCGAFHEYLWLGSGARQIAAVGDS
jgi:hypothetical protein